MNDQTLRQMTLATTEDATDMIELRRVTRNGKTLFNVVLDGELVFQSEDRMVADKRFVRECRDYFHEML